MHRVLPYTPCDDEAMNMTLLASVGQTCTCWHLLGGCMPALYLLSFCIQRSLLVCKMHIGHLAWVVQNGLNLL